MTPESAGASIRTLFQAQGGIDREIEKVIDYYRVADESLRREIQEYEVTDAIARNLRTFLDSYERTVAAAPTVASSGTMAPRNEQEGIEIGAWVAGFYGSGKSSFTKYLGFALDPTRRIGDRAFVEFLADRIHDPELRQLLRTTAQRYPAAVVNLDLGSDQLVIDPGSPVTNVLYQRVLRWAGYSKVQLLADLEYELDRRKQLGAFADAFASRFGTSWEEMHDDSLLGVAQAAQIVPEFLPNEFPNAEAFRATKHDIVNETVHDRALKMFDLVRRRTGHANVIFMVDEAAQYVAARRELMLNLQGLAQSLKDVGQGHAWIVATGQQALTELVESAALNSGELSRLKDRFPIQLNLEASDIREITWRRLLRKSGTGENDLKNLFDASGQALVTHARIQGSREFTNDPTRDDFVRFYPFLSTHFSLLLNTVRALARAGHGALGLRSAIRLVQDVLVQRGAGGVSLADAPVGTLVTIDRIYDVLHADIQRVLEHVPAAIAHVAAHHPDGIALRVAKAIGALQPLDSFPRTAENIAALLYPRIGAPSEVAQVTEALRTLAADPEAGLADDPEAGGYTFMSAGIQPLIRRRDNFVPPNDELEAMRLAILREVFTDRPSARLLNTRTINADVVLGERRPVIGNNEAIRFQLEFVGDDAIASRRDALLAETVAPGGAWATRVAWLCRTDPTIEDALRQAVRFSWSASANAGNNDPSVQQFVRTERRMADVGRRDALRSIEGALMDGTLIFGGNPMPAATIGGAPDRAPATAVSACLRQVAERIYTRYHLAKANASTDLATKVLDLTDLSRVSADRDPLGFVARGAGGVWQVDATHQTLDEARRAFDRLTTHVGRIQLNGSTILDHFADPPYGWLKDVTRYVFAAIFRAGHLRLHTAQAGVVTTVGPVALDAFRTTQSFNRATFSRRDDAPSIEMLQRASQRLQEFVANRVLMDADTIARVTRERIPGKVDQIRELPARLEALHLAGVDRADRAIADTEAMLADEGAGAIQQLGGTAVPAVLEDYKWALRLANALTPATRREIADAREALQAVTVAGITVDANVRAAIADLDSTEEVVDRLPDMRDAVRTISDQAAVRARQVLGDARQAYEDTMRNIDRLGGWASVDPKVQREIKDRVQPIPSDETDQSAGTRSPIGALRDAVTARMRLAAEAEASLQAAAEAIVAVPKDTDPVINPPGPVPPQPSIVQLGFADLFGARITITSSAEVDAAVDAVRARLQREIDAGRTVQLGS